MEMMNRAIEGASDFRDMMRKLQEPMPQRPAVVITPEMRAALPPKRPGENRRDYRARVMSTQKAAA